MWVTVMKAISFGGLMATPMGGSWQRLMGIWLAGTAMIESRVRAGHCGIV